MHLPPRNAAWIGTIGTFLLSAALALASLGLSLMPAQPDAVLAHRVFLAAEAAAALGVLLLLVSIILWVRRPKEVAAATPVHHPRLIVEAGLLPFRMVEGRRATIAVLRFNNVARDIHTPAAKLIAYVNHTDRENRRYYFYGAWSGEPIPQDSDAPALPIEVAPGTERVLEIALSFDDDFEWYAMDYHGGRRRLQFPIALTDVVSVRLVGNIPDEDALHVCVLRRTTNGTTSFKRQPTIPGAMAQLRMQQEQALALASG